MAAVPTFAEVSALLVEAAVRGTVLAGASRQQAAAVASAAVRTALTSKDKGTSDEGYSLEERFEVIKQSLAVHQGDCRALGHHVHSAAKAAVMVGGAELKEKVKLHRGAGVAKHVDLHSEAALGTLRGRRGGRQQLADGVGGSSHSASGKGNFLKGKGTGHKPGEAQAEAGFVVAKVDEVFIEAAIVQGSQGSQPEAAGATGKEFVGEAAAKIFGARLEQHISDVQNSNMVQQEVAEEVVDGGAEGLGHIEAAMEQGSQGSQEEAAEASGKEVVGEAVDKFIGAALEPGIAVPRGKEGRQVKQVKDSGEAGQLLEQCLPKGAAAKVTGEVVDGCAVQYIGKAVEEVLDGFGGNEVKQTNKLEHIIDAPRSMKGRQVKQADGPREVGQVPGQDLLKEAAMDEAEDIVDGFAVQHIEEVKRTKGPQGGERKKFGQARLQGSLQPKQL